MMKKQCMVTFILLSLFSSINGQNTAEDRVRAFVKAAANNSEPVEKLASEYICTPAGENDPQKNEKNQFVITQLTNLRNDILPRNITNLAIKKYKDLPETEQTLLIDANKEKDVYVVCLDNKAYITVLLLDQRIYSFVTLNKGGKRVFLELCAAKSQ